MSRYEELSKMCRKFIKDNDITFVMVKSPVQESDHVTQERINRMNNGLIIIDHTNLLRKDLQGRK